LKTLKTVETLIYSAESGRQPMNALGAGLVNTLNGDGWVTSWTRHENEGGTLVYQVAADKGNVHLCAEGRGLTEALARLYQLCNRGSSRQTQETIKNEHAD
jgi:hypothetical protein